MNPELIQQEQLFLQMLFKKNEQILRLMQEVEATKQPAQETPQ